MLVVIKLLALTLSLCWKLSIRNNVIAVDEKPQAAIGVVKDPLVVIANAQTYIPLQVINLTSKTLLLRID